MGVGGGEEEEEEVPKARMITSIRARIRCRGRLRGCPREGENRRKPRSTQGPSSKALLGPAMSACEKDTCQALSQPSCARVGLIAVGRGRAGALDRDALRAGREQFTRAVSGFRLARRDLCVP